MRQIKEILRLSSETIDGYAAANKKEAQLEKNFNLDLKNTLVEKSAVEKIFKIGTERGGSEEWKEFYNQFPKSGGIVGVSCIGFNPAKNKALVYLEHWCRTTCGTGHYVVLSKEQGKWKFLQEFSPWIS